MLVLDKGTEWCPDSDHSAAKIPTPSLARAQQAVLDAARPEPDGA
jgi:hypothetical protein